ncbi:hypothetical protein BASA60_001728 [Batrachochytrium salamandrivorans]|nr:hypothetical protein BASA60_001728 [Batrachochytrium salamandrivorans]
MAEPTTRKTTLTSSISSAQTKGMQSGKSAHFGSKLKQQVVQPTLIERSESDDDDAEDEDDDTGQINDGDSVNWAAKGRSMDRHKGQLAKLSGETCKWSADEQTAVLDFYSLETLFPRKWTDDPNIIMPITPISSSESKLSLLPISPAKSIQGKSVAANGRIDTSDPLGIKETVLRRGKRRESQILQPRASLIFISEKSFDSIIFLSEVHRLSLYKDLEQGAVFLKMAIEQRDEVIKGLVKKHFAKFVSAKGTIDTFYREMCQKNLISSSDSGIAPFANALQELESNADKLYGPVLGRRSNGDKIKATLSILEGWKFFFNLPSSLVEQIRKGKYDGAVRDYKKGKYLMHSSFSDNALGGKELRLESRSIKDTSGLLPKTHREVFEKVWSEVEQIIRNLREELFARLGDPSHSVDAQEKQISYLVDLDAEKSPVKCFLERQYLWLVEKFKGCYLSYVSKINGVRQTFPSGYKSEIDSAISSQSPDELKKESSTTDLKSNVPHIYLKNSNADYSPPVVAQRPPDILTLYELKKGFSQATSHSFELLFCNNDDAQSWKLTLRFIQEICSLLCSRLPDLCKICKIYIDGRLTKTKMNDSNRKAGQARRIELVGKIIKNITELVAAILEGTFGLRMSFMELSLLLGKKHRGQSLNQEAAIFSPFSVTDRSTRASPSAMSPDTPTMDVKDDWGSATNDFDDSFDESIVHLDLSFISLETNRLAFLLAHPLIATHYSAKIVSVLSQMFVELQHISFVREDTSFSAMSIILTQTQMRLVESICEGYQATSVNFYTYEDWSYEAKLVFVYKIVGFVFRRFNLHVSIDATLSTPVSQSTQKDLRSNSALTLYRQTMADKIKSSCFESLYLFLDGLQCLTTRQCVENISGGSSEDRSCVIHQKWIAGNSGYRLPFANQITDKQWTGKKDRKLIQHNIETRSFVILGNLAFIKTVFIPKISMMLEQKLHIPVYVDTKSLLDTIDYLDSLLVKNYVRRQILVIKTLLESGILYSGLDWSMVSKTQDVRPYCHQALLHLVLVHAAISEVSKSHVPRIMSEMLLSVANCILIAYRSIDSFSTSGMLQATLETEFLHHTLKAYDTAETIAVMGIVYDTIERSTLKADQSHTLLNDALLRVKGYLQQSKTATEVQFACFRDGNAPERSD